MKTVRVEVPMIVMGNGNVRTINKSHLGHSFPSFIGAITTERYYECML
jgi:hypothetical protein